MTAPWEAKRHLLIIKPLFTSQDSSFTVFQATQGTLKIQKRKEKMNIVVFQTIYIKHTAKKPKKHHQVTCLFQVLCIRWGEPTL